MNERQHLVLSLFYDEGHPEVTPSFLAYRLRMSVRDATSLLDDMVKHDLLDIHIDDEGQIVYRLPTSEWDRLSEGLPDRPPELRGGPGTPPGSASPGRPPGSASPGSPAWHPPQGTDASPGFAPGPAPAQPQQFRAHQRGSQDGTDGSVAPSFSGAFTRREAAPPPANHHPDAPYQDWYSADEPAQHNPHHPPHTAYAHHQSPYHQPPYPGAMPQGAALTPYQSRQLAHQRRASQSSPRVPILAGLLSLMVPGLGQFYNGEIGKGVMLMFSCLFLWVFMLFWIVWIWSVIDAYMVAEQNNQRALNDEGMPRHLLPDHGPRSSNTNAA